MTGRLYLQILDMTKIAGIVILVVIFIRWLFLSDKPKVFSYALWGIVLFRLLCPVSVYSLMSALPKLTPVGERYSLKDLPVSFFDAGEAVYRAVGDVFNGGIGTQYVRTTLRANMADISDMILPAEYYDAPRSPVYASANLRDIAILAGNYVWIAGVLAMLVHSLVSYLKIRKRIKVSVLLRENIYVADDIEVPFIMGILSPKIYLPCGMNEEEQEYVILHETYHIRRFDHIIKALAFFALCLHWFHPLVWIAFILACRDMEMSCDEAVMKKMEGDKNKIFRAGYSETLLKFAAAGKSFAGTPLAFGEGNIRGRIKNLAKWKRSTGWVSLGAGALCLFLAFCLMTNPYPTTRNPQKYAFDLWGNSRRVDDTADAPRAASGEAGDMVFADVEEQLQKLFDRYAQDGYVYLKNGVIEDGQELWLDFLTNSLLTDIRIISCRTLSADYPVVETMTLSYDKDSDSYQLAAYGGSTGSMKTHLSLNVDAMPGESGGQTTRYVLSDGDDSEFMFTIILK